MFRNISALTFKIGTYCNLDCKYCFQKHDIKTHNDKFNIYKDTVKFLSNNKITFDKELEIKITGGEPSIYCSDMRTAYNEFKKLERYQPTKIYFTTISNGFNINGLLELMDEKILDPYGCKISWDGIYSASKSRIPKSNIFNDKFFNDNIKTLGKSRYKSDVLVRIALTDDTVDDLYDSFVYALSCGCTKLEYYLLSDYDLYKDENFLKRFEDQLIKIYSIREKFLWANRETLLYTEKISSDNYHKAITCRHLGKMLYIEQNGDIAPCGFFSNDSVYGDSKFYIGNIYKGFYKDRIQQFIDEYAYTPSCFRNTNQACSNLHCFECPAVALYRNKHLQSKLYQTCALKTLEKKVFYAFNNVEPDEQVEKTYNYIKNLKYDFSLPELPYC